MAHIEIIIEKTGTGYSAYAKSVKYPVATTDDTIADVKKNAVMH